MVWNEGVSRKSSRAETMTRRDPLADIDSAGRGGPAGVVRGVAGRTSGVRVCPTRDTGRNRIAFSLTGGKQRLYSHPAAENRVRTEAVAAHGPVAASGWAAPNRSGSSHSTTAGWFARRSRRSDQRHPANQTAGQHPSAAQTDRGGSNPPTPPRRAEPRPRQPTAAGPCRSRKAPARSWWMSCVRPDAVGFQSWCVKSL